jgi:hypothetical protein
MSNDRERRLKATGKWFQSSIKRKLWVNHVFPILLTVSFIFYLLTL